MIDSPKSLKLSSEPAPSESSRGLGDTVAKVLEFLGVEKGPDCGCTQRQEWLNEKFPYKVVR
jgi:hypothetical protein